MFVQQTLRSLVEDIRTSTMGLFKEDEELELKASVTKLKHLCRWTGDIIRRNGWFCKMA